MPGWRMTFKRITKGRNQKVMDEFDFLEIMTFV